eukprot:12974660-Ditylum_brightwellii.AAC.1
MPQSRKSQDLDTLKWPILKQDYKTHPGQTLKNNLKVIKLISNELTNIEVFYDSINSAVGTAIGQSYAFKMYDEMADNDYDIAAMLLQPTLRIRYNKA